MSVAGTYKCVTKSPMGDQASTLTVVPSDDGKTFTGSNDGPSGALPVQNGVINGNDLMWTAKMTSPMPMTLECKATVDGDDLTGEVKAGNFGTMAMSGQRVS